MSLPVCDVIRYVHDPDGFSTVALHDGRTEEVAEVECQLAFFHIHKNTCTHIIAVILSIVILYELLHSALSPGEISLLSICPVIYLSLSVLKSFFCSSPNSFFPPQNVIIKCHPLLQTVDKQRNLILLAFKCHNNPSVHGSHLVQKST